MQAVILITIFSLTFSLQVSGQINNYENNIINGPGEPKTTKKFCDNIIVCSILNCFATAAQYKSKQVKLTDVYTGRTSTCHDIHLKSK